MKIKDKAKPLIPPVPAGGYLAVCVGIYDLGNQFSEKFKNYSQKVLLSFDIPSLTVEVDGKQEPRQLSREFTFSAKGNSKLRSFVSSWAGVQFSDDGFADFDLLSMLGKPALISVLLNETGEYSNIDSIMPMLAGMQPPTTTTPLRSWDCDHWDDKAFEDLPEWVRGKIQKSTEYQKLHAPATEVAVMPPEAAQGATAAQPALVGQMFGQYPQLAQMQPTAPMAAQPVAPAVQPQAAPAAMPQIQQFIYQQQVATPSNQEECPI